ncbi:MAG TPA: ATP-binding protein, partial [Coriobacteriia bacterium]|nr:ATP-binding protein [Coriobacteriia bacterium]
MGWARCTEVVGRDAERALLAARLHGVAEGSSATVVLLGDAGVGKSRLLRELAERAASAGHLVLEGRSIDSGSGTPLRPFVEVLLAAWTAGCDLSTPELVPF